MGSHTRSPKKPVRERTDKEKLELFVRRVNELLQTRLSINGCCINHNVSYQAGQTVQSKLDQPAEADLKEHLMVFRHFIAESEDTFLYKIFSIFYTRCTDKEGKQCIVELRRTYNKVKESNFVKIILNNEEYTPLRITDMYINSEYFHNDLQYQEFLSSLDPLTKDMFRAHFLNFVVNVSKIAIVLKNDIEYGFKSNVFNF